MARAAEKPRGRYGIRPIRPGVTVPCQAHRKKSIVKCVGVAKCRNKRPKRGAEHEARRYVRPLFNDELSLFS